MIDNLQPYVDELLRVSQLPEAVREGAVRTVLGELLDNLKR